MAVTVLGSGTSNSDVSGTKVINKDSLPNYIYGTTTSGITLVNTTATTNVALIVNSHMSDFDVTAIRTDYLQIADATGNFNAPSTITHTANGFITAGFQVGDSIRVALDGDLNDNALFTIAVGGLVAGVITTDEATVQNSLAKDPLLIDETIDWVTFGTNINTTGILYIPVTVEANTGAADRSFSLLIVDKSDSSNRYVINVTQSSP